MRRTTAAAVRKQGAERVGVTGFEITDGGRHPRTQFLGLRCPPIEVPQGSGQRRVGAGRRRTGHEPTAPDVGSVLTGPEIVRPGPDALSPGTHAGLGHGLAYLDPLRCRAARGCRGDRDPPVAVPFLLRRMPAHLLAGLAGQQRASQAVAALRRLELAVYDHPRQRHPGRTARKPKELGGPHQALSRELRRPGAQQHAGQDRPGRQRTIHRRTITFLHQLTSIL